MSLTTDLLSATQLWTLVAAVALGAFVKSVTGMGMPLVAVPIAALFVPSHLVIAAVAVPNLVQNLLLMWQTRTERTKVPQLARFVGAGLIGALAGAVLASRVSDRVLTLALVVIVGLYLASVASSSPFRPSVRQRSVLELPVGFVAGGFQGALGISGPIVVAWFQSLELERDAFVFAIATTFGLSGAIQCAEYARQGRFDGLWWLIVALTMIVLISLPIGHRVRDRLPAKRFSQAIIALITISWLLEIASLFG